MRSLGFLCFYEPAGFYDGWNLAPTGSANVLGIQSASGNLVRITHDGVSPAPGFGFNTAGAGWAFNGNPYHIQASGSNYVDVYGPAGLNFGAGGTINFATLNPVPVSNARLWTWNSVNLIAGKRYQIRRAIPVLQFASNLVLTGAIPDQPMLCFAVYSKNFMDSAFPAGALRANIFARANAYFPGPELVGEFGRVPSPLVNSLQVVSSAQSRSYPFGSAYTLMQRISNATDWDSTMIDPVLQNAAWSWTLPLSTTANYDAGPSAEFVATENQALFVFASIELNTAVFPTAGNAKRIGGRVLFDLAEVGEA